MARRTGLEIAAITVVALLGAGGEPRSSAAPTRPCAAALARFCKDVPAGEGRLRACLMAHERELPADCRARIRGEQAKGSPRAEAPMGPRELHACRADLAAHCADVPSGGGRLLACLREHATVIAPGCKAAIARTSAPRPPSTEPSPPTKP